MAALPANLFRQCVARNAAGGKRQTGAAADGQMPTAPCPGRAKREPGPTITGFCNLDPGSRAFALGRETRLLCVRLALRIDDLLELAEHMHAGEDLLQAGVRLALALDGGDELAVLELDAVHRDVDLGD